MPGRGEKRLLLNYRLRLLPRPPTLCDSSQRIFAPSESLCGQKAYRGWTLWDMGQGDQVTRSQGDKVKKGGERLLSFPLHLTFLFFVTWSPCHPVTSSRHLRLATLAEPV